MKRIAWITDGSTKFKKEKTNDTYIMPIQIIIDDKTYTDGVDIEKEEFIEILKEDKKKITTSQPSIGQVAEELEKLKNDYDEIIIMTISEKLSGTKNCIKQAADMVGIKNTTIETSSIGHGVGNMIIEAQDMLKKEKTIEEIKEKIEKEHLNYKGYAVVGSIERIKNSGRINSLTALVGSLLNIVPIIEIGNGELKQSGKTRGKEKAVKDIMSRIDKEKVEEVFLMGLEAESQINKLKEEYKEKDIYEEDLILPLAVHGGIGTFLIIVKEKKES